MQPDRSEITGIILAGGKSKRMGADKALLYMDGKMLIGHVIEALETVCNSIIIVSGDSRLDQFGKPRFADRVENVGPLAGLYTGLHHSSSPYNIVLGCDTPLVNKTLFDLLLQQADAGFDVVQLGTSDNTMPLIALYHKSCSNKLLSIIESGVRRMQEAVATLNAKTLQIDAPLEKYTLNINRPEDLGFSQ